jgi:hypothetical protein
MGSLWIRFQVVVIMKVEELTLVDMESWIFDENGVAGGNSETVEECGRQIGRTLCHRGSVLQSVLFRE